MSLSPPVTPRSATKAHAAAYVSLDNRASESTTNPKCISLWNFVPTQEFQKFRRDPSGVVNNSVNFDRRPSPVSYSQHARESASTHKMGRGRNAERPECRTKIGSKCRTPGMPNGRNGEKWATLLD